MAQVQVGEAWVNDKAPGFGEPQGVANQQSTSELEWGNRRAASCPTGPENGLIRNLANTSSPDIARAFSFEVSNLRAAATAAVAEVTSMPLKSTPSSSSVSGRRATRSDDLHEHLSAKIERLSLHSPPHPPDGQHSAAPTSSQPPGSPSQGARDATATASTSQQPPPEQTPLARSQRCPPHGIKAICGRRPRMEDAYSAIPFLLEVPVPSQRSQQELIPERIATDLQTPSPRASMEGPIGDSFASGPDEAPQAPTSHIQEPWQPYLETLHFFGVFDGHGGADAAAYCAQTLHQRIVEAVNATTSPPSSGENSSPRHAQHHAAKPAPAAGHGSAAPQEPSIPEDASVAPEAAAGPGSEEAAASFTPAPASPSTGGTPFSSFQASATEGSTSQQGSDEAGTKLSGQASLSEPLTSQESEALIKASLAEHAAEPDPPDAWRDVSTCTPKGFEAALAAAFSRVDEDFGKGESAALVGTTVVVALVGSRQLYVANCGDSRAVLCRDNVAIPLTEDHKAAREDEVARIEALGGQILYWNGVRVMGVLAVSRAVGDHCLRPFVIAQPEVTIIDRRPEDELLLLASDGLWDVLSNSEAVTLAKRCLRRARQRGASRQSAARIAATVLTRAAFDRGSRDNVTVVVIDLGLGGMESDAGDDSEVQAPSARTTGAGSDEGSSPDKPTHAARESEA